MNDWWGDDWNVVLIRLFLAVGLGAILQSRGLVKDEPEVIEVSLDG